MVEMHQVVLAVVVVVVGLLASLATGEETTIASTSAEPFWLGKDCVRNEDGTVRDAAGEEDPNTVFSCKEEESCCTKNLKPACCAVKPTDQAVQEQITLWGTLLSIILVLGLFIWFCRSDQSLLDAETPCLHKFCPCAGYKKRGDDGHLSDTTPLGSQTSLQSSKSTVLVIPDDDEAEHVEDDAANLEAVLEPEEGEEGEAGGEEGEAADVEAPAAEEGEGDAAEGAEDADGGADGGDGGDGGGDGGDGGDGGE